jgi:hypothetical protein
MWFFLALALAASLFATVEPWLIVPAMALLMLFKSRKPLFYLFVALGWLWEIYVVLAWCIFASLLTAKFSMRSLVVYHWMYWVIGFFGCLAPIIFMLSFNKNKELDDPIRELQQFLTLTLSTTGFIGFTVMPSLMRPWVWALRFLR